MNRPTLLLTLAAVAMCLAPPAAVAQPPATASQPTLLQTYDSHTPQYRDADAVLNDARLAAGNAASARQLAQRLQEVLETAPEYPYRGMVAYYLGVNYQVLEEYPEAVNAFEAALRDRPDLAGKTAILSYLKTARRKVFKSRMTTTLFVVLTAALALAIWGLLRSNPAPVRWGPLVVIFAVALAVWVAVVVLLPRILGPPEGTLGNYPKPTLIAYHLGQYGDAKLQSLLWHGLGAILALFPIAAAASRIRYKVLRGVLVLLGVVLASGSVMGLFWMRHCFDQYHYHPESRRVVFMVKDIGTPQDVPDEMLPLYEESFRARVLQKRKTPPK